MTLCSQCVVRADAFARQWGYTQRRAHGVFQRACGASGRVRAIVGRYRQALPRSRVLLLGLMPRAGRYWEPSERFWPNNYTAALGDVNAGYQACSHASSYEQCLN